MFIKNVCQSMGVMYIKLAQIISTRSDIIKDTKSRKDLCELNDNCIEMDYESIEKILKQEYGEKLNKIFKEISKEPIGSASVSQVHKGILYNGDTVAIKIKRNDITKSMPRDAKFILRSMKFLGIFSSTIRYLYNSKGLDSYIDWILQEVDFINEKENLVKMYEYTNKLNSENNVNVKKEMLSLIVYEKYCTENVIVMEYVPYQTINKMPVTDENNKKISIALNSYLQLYFYAVFNYDEVLYHADPHIGNLYLDNVGNLGFIDFGLVAKFTKDDLSYIKELAIAIYTRNENNLYVILMQLSGRYGYPLNKKKKELKLKNDIERFFLKADKQKVTEWFVEMAFMCINNQLYMPTFFYSFAKAIATIDGINLYSSNNICAEDLLKEQFRKYYIKDICTQLVHEPQKAIKSILSIINN